MDRECKKYLQELRLAFPVFRKSERRFYNDFRDNIEEYQNISQNITRKDLDTKFGCPKEVVVEYFNNMGAATYMKLMHKTKYTKILVFIVFLFLAVSFLFQTYSINQMRKEVRDTKIVSESTEIVYIE